MDFSVTTELVEARKVAPTLGTLERPVAAMDAHVLVEVAALSKLLAATLHGAHKGTVTCVRTLVDRQAACNAERLVAPGEVTLVRPLLRVNAHVLRERRRFREALLAHTTHIWAVARVRLHVPQHFLALRKGASFLGTLAAYPAALVLILAGANVVARNVLGKLGMRRETLITVLPATCVRLLARRRRRAQARRVKLQQRRHIGTARQLRERRPRSRR